MVARTGLLRETARRILVSAKVGEPPEVIGRKLFSLVEFCEANEFHKGVEQIVAGLVDDDKISNTLREMFGAVKDDYLKAIEKAYSRLVHGYVELLGTDDKEVVTWLENEPKTFEIRDVGPYGLWTTIVVHPNHPIDRPCRGFHYAIGSDIPGLHKVSACRSDTNMNVTGQLVDETMQVESVSWRIPPIALGKFQQNDKDYRVTHEDVSEFVRNARLTVHTGKRAIEIPLEDVEADAIGGHGATFNLGQRAFDIERLETFWVELALKGSLMINGTIPLIVTLDGARARGVQ